MNEHFEYRLYWTLAVFIAAAAVILFVAALIEGCT
jgi:hypothetical protein